MSFRSLDPPKETQGAKVRASIGDVRKTGPILTALSICPEDGATRKKRSK
jgi:hypothetical protein